MSTWQPCEIRCHGNSTMHLLLLYCRVATTTTATTTDNNEICLQTNFHAQFAATFHPHSKTSFIIRTNFVIQFVNMPLLEKGKILEFASEQMQYPISWVLLLLPTLIYFVRKWIKGPTKGNNICKTFLKRTFLLIMEFIKS